MEKRNIAKLNWDTSQQEINRNLKQIWNDQCFTDVTLAFDDEVQIKTNRTLLAAISPVLRGAMKSVSGHNSCIFLFGMESSTVKSLLEFVYQENINIEKDKLEHFLNTARKLKINGFIEANEAEHKKVDNVNVGISPRNLPDESIEIKKGIDILNDIEDYVPVIKTKIDDLWNVEVEASGAVDFNNKVLPTDMSRIFGLPNDLDSLTRTIDTVESERDQLSTLIGLYPPQKVRKIKEKWPAPRLLGPAPVREEFEIFSFIDPSTQKKLHRSRCKHCDQVMRGKGITHLENHLENYHKDISKKVQALKMSLREKLLMEELRMRSNVDC